MPITVGSVLRVVQHILVLLKIIRFAFSELLKIKAIYLKTEDRVANYSDLLPSVDTSSIFTSMAHQMDDMIYRSVYYLPIGIILEARVKTFLKGY